MYETKQIAREILATAMGETFYGNALRVAKDLPGVTEEERHLLDACMRSGIDFYRRMRLQDLAIKILRINE